MLLGKESLQISLFTRTWEGQQRAAHGAKNVCEPYRCIHLALQICYDRQVI